MHSPSTKPWPDIGGYGVRLGFRSKRERVHFFLFFFRFLVIILFYSFLLCSVGRKFVLAAEGRGRGDGGEAGVVFLSRILLAKCCIVPPQDAP